MSRPSVRAKLVAEGLLMREARCNCGQLWIRCDGEPEKVSACHCTECQRRTGSAFGVAVFFREAATEIHGASTVYERIGDSGLPVVHHFCPKCGSTVFWYAAKKPGQVAVAIGCFADNAFPGPTQAVYEPQRQPWVSIDLNLGAGRR